MRAAPCLYPLLYMPLDNPSTRIEVYEYTGPVLCRGKKRGTGVPAGSHQTGACLLSLAAG